MSRNALFITLALLAAPAFAGNYTQAPGSSLAFAGKYQGDVFTGKFPGFATRFSFDPKQLAASKLEVTIPLASATTANADYDGELRGDAFFNSTKFPQAKYTATKFRALGGNRYAADGTLSLRGVSKPVVLEFTWTPGAKPVLAGKATVKRLDFGVGGGDWADTTLIPDAIAISTKVGSGSIAATAPTKRAARIAATSPHRTANRVPCHALRRATPVRAGRSALPAWRHRR
jgi:polyisoprenoid-binding protein YceI